ncbi:MAG: hypothetical protein U0575_16175 [Phycisphaerales bacterium]
MPKKTGRSRRREERASVASQNAANARDAAPDPPRPRRLRQLGDGASEYLRRKLELPDTPPDEATIERTAIVATFGFGAVVELLEGLALRRVGKMPPFATREALKAVGTIKAVSHWTVQPSNSDDLQSTLRERWACSQSQRFGDVVGRGLAWGPSAAAVALQVTRLVSGRIPSVGAWKIAEGEFPLADAIAWPDPDPRFESWIASLTQPIFEGSASENNPPILPSAFAEVRAQGETLLGNIEEERRRSIAAANAREPVREIAPGGERRTDTTANGDGDDTSAEARVLALLIRHRNWTDTQIAKAAGVARTSLYRLPNFKAARQAQRDGGTLAKGSKNRESGIVEAWED